MNKKVLTLSAILFSSIICINAQNKSFKIKGSDTCLPLSQKEAESFMKKDSSTVISISSGGTSVGIAALINGSTDIADASRNIKLDETLKIKESGKTLQEVVVAYDALAVIVNKNNKLDQLTREQLEGIFTGNITNWKEVGGEDLKIVLYSRETSSGTYEFFKEHVLNKNNFAAFALLLPATGAIVKSVSETKGAIGYVGLAYVDKNIKTINVSYDKGKTFVEPNFNNAKNKSYPVTRPLLYYYLKENEAKVNSYIDFVLSSEGQAIVAKVGFIPVK